jgi:glycerol kinase
MSVLAIDAGTTGVTALIVTQDGRIAGRGYAEFSQYFPQPGWVEQLPEEIWQATLTACAQALADGSRSGAGGAAAGTAGRAAGGAGGGAAGGAGGGAEPVSCVGITNQRETAVVWDSATLTSPHRAIVWQDRRTARICADLRDSGHEDRVAELTGLRIDPYFTATKLTWLSRHADDIWAGVTDRSRSAPWTRT